MRATLSMMAVTVVVVLGVTACGTPEPGVPDAGSEHELACNDNHAQVTAEQVYADVFDAKCKSCHMTGSSGTTFFADDAAQLREAVGQESSYPGDLKIVDANRSENSTLFLKINGGSPKHRGPNNEAVGGPMPQGDTITEEQIQLFHDWICTGAN